MASRPLHRVVLATILLHAYIVYGQNLKTLQTPKPRPSGGPITVTTGPTGAGFSDVTLHYVVNYGQENTLSMPATDGYYSATILSSNAQPGNLVRWYVTATYNGNTVRDPPYKSQDDQKYYGTIVEDTSDSHSLPVVELYCEDSNAPYDTNKRNAGPSCSMLYRNRFYDNIVIRRRGSSSMNWAKPKFKIDAGKTQGEIFDLKDDYYKLQEFNMNSEWFEPGENTFMRETLGWKVFKDMGVDSIMAYQTVVRMNGKYYGKFSLSEDWDNEPLKRNGYSTKPTGYIWKSFDGEKGNLRYDVSAGEMSYYYNLTTSKTNEQQAAQKLVEFKNGIAGGGNVKKSKYLFDAVNLPKTINHLAAESLVLNQDRCTKNFQIYYDQSSGQWSFLPWDVESAFTIDRGLGGGPNLNDYCTLACEQWNSPLYCDRKHPQDLQVSTPWTLITTTINPNTLKGRRLLDSASTSSNGNNNGGNSYDNPGLTPSDWSSLPTDYDTDLTRQGPTSTGAPGTFNYLIDAILSVPRTRAMYLRRLRSLMDSYLPTGKLQSLVTEEYNLIKDEAKRDSRKWGNPGDPDRGYQQLITEQLPIRRDQLYNTYGPGGSIPLIPEAQPSYFSLTVGEVAYGSNGYVEIKNDNDFAADVSGWKVSGSGVSFTFVPGTVIPAHDSVYVAAGSIGEFKNRKGGQGYFVVGPMSGSPNSGDGISVYKG